MKINEGTLDRILRLVAGVAIITWGFLAQNWLGAIGIIPLVTGLIGWCPLYSVLHLNTCPAKKS
ncbi:PF11127 family protein [Leptospira inadai serovar Lyme str. 10]|uniref:PF11127 family protein n=2 Tax=Leptospira inadai serovar Lyme TaxID=293084 RepID=V6H9U4_9LEPT|nr:DUF2892 domain-containing protein [Leptospira inadai]EQA35817.1 PF11127 family protein [Leptospira inadai serovar Lyme str. 10]PNV76973.1 DUF2892 domain-containing protein [Leptospira inadai serovar Lyme]